MKLQGNYVQAMTYPFRTIVVPPGRDGEVLRFVESQPGVSSYDPQPGKIYMDGIFPEGVSNADGLKVLERQAREAQVALEQEYPEMFELTFKTLDDQPPCEPVEGNGQDIRTDFACPECRAVVVAIIPDNEPAGLVHCRHFGGDRTCDVRIYFRVDAKAGELVPIGYRSDTGELKTEKPEVLK